MLLNSLHFLCASAVSLNLSLIHLQIEPLPKHPMRAGCNEIESMAF